MKLFLTRALSLIALIGLYAVNPLLGVAGLVAGFGVLVWQRSMFRTLAPSSNAGD
jgi:hypothetical protein